MAQVFNLCIKHLLEQHRFKTYATSSDDVKLLFMERLRICQLITELGVAGAERFLYELTHRLDRSRFCVHVAALRGGAVADWMRRAGVGVTVLDVRNKLDVVALMRLVNLLRDRKIQLLHTHLFHADLVGRIAARLAGVPYLVHTVHVAEGRFRPWQYAWTRLTANWCDRIVCISQAVRDHHAHRSYLPVQRYKVIYYGIDAEPYAPDARRRKELRDRWGVQPQEILIAFVGRLVHQKNLPLLLDAARRLLRVRSDIHIVIAGDGPDAPVIERFRREDKSHRAIWLGLTDDVAGVLSAADIFVQPSRWEGFGLAAAEAMAAGLPVVGTKVPGLTELIEDGVSGLLIDSEDLDALTSTIERLADDRNARVRLGSAAQRRVRKQFSITANVAAHERLYETVASGAHVLRETR